MKNISNKPHIIVVTTAFAPFIGGAEVAVQEIIRRTADSFRYTIITARMDRKLSARELWNDAEIIRVGWGCAFDKLWLIVIFPWFAYKLHANLVWAIMASYAGAGACLASFIQKTPYVLTLQEGDDLSNVERRIRFLTPFFRQIFIRAQSTQVIAQFLGDWAKKMGASHEPIVIPNGVSRELFMLTDKERNDFRLEIREMYKIPQDAFVVVSISRLVEKNGISDLISAITLLPDAHLLVIGDGKLRDSLERQSEIIRSRVHFLGSIRQTDLVRFAVAGDVFCRPALSEGQGIVFLEAFSLGLPVVATKVGGIPEIVEHSVSGLLVEPKQINQLVEALNSLSVNRQLYTQMRLAGFERVKKFSWDLLTPKIKNWLSSNIK
jgi:glycosyltransferase involved in cell wall biosynthesis